MPMLSFLAKSLYHEILSLAVVVVLCTWLSALAGALIAYCFQNDDPERSVGGFFRFCFPGIILRHRSCRIDVAYIGIFWLLAPVLFAPVLFTNLLFATAAYKTLGRLFGTHAAQAQPLWMAGIIVGGAVVLYDFMTFYTHYLEHRVAAGWEIHKVHHSAEVLTPITNHRFHPLQEIFDNFGRVVPVGILLALPLEDNCANVGRAYLILNTLSFYHLRHSHIALSYGRFEKYFLSPAQHHLHHSQEPQHWDKNFGLLLSCWDRMFGTLIYARRGERFRLGLPAVEQRQFDATWKLYVMPLVNLARMATAGRRRAEARAEGAMDLADGNPMAPDSAAIG
jgi:sterol desaturase/sphingolipid hydroxylase (fatty acid hydroxylase superfamily)